MKKTPLAFIVVLLLAGISLAGTRITNQDIPSILQFGANSATINGTFNVPYSSANALSFWGNGANLTSLNGANLQADSVDATKFASGLKTPIQSNPAGSYKQVTATEYDPTSGLLRLTYSDGGSYQIYLGTDTVARLLPGSGISVSPSNGRGNVTVTATGAVSVYASSVSLPVLFQQQWTNTSFSGDNCIKGSTLTITKVSADSVVEVYGSAPAGASTSLYGRCTWKVDGGLLTGWGETPIGGGTITSTELREVKCHFIVRGLGAGSHSFCMAVKTDVGTITCPYTSLGGAGVFWVKEIQ